MGVCGRVSIRNALGLVHAEYAAEEGVVVTASVEGTIRMLASDGTERDTFEYTLPDGSDLYTLVPSIVTELSVAMVLAHDPPHRGEALWQHEIDIERKEIGGPSRSGADSYCR